MENPLLTPATPLPFDKIEAAHIEPAIFEHLKEGRAALDRIAAEQNLSYDSTFGALERATEKLETAMGLVEHLESVKSSPELRAAYNAVQPHVSEFYSGIALHEGLYKALRTFGEAHASSPSEQLSPTQARFMRKTLEDFARHGAELDPEGKKALQAVDRELSEKTTAFSQNLLDGTNAFELVVDEGRLSGLPEFVRKAARASAEEKGLSGYRFTLQAPSVIPALTYADDASFRREMWTAFNARGAGNLPLVRDILKLRRKKAKLLGFANFADLVTADRMAKDGREASDFVEALRLRTVAAFEQENDALLAFRRELEGPEAPQLNSWDVAYYAEKQRKKLYDFDEEQLRPYFSAPNVLQGAFDLAEKLYGVKIEDANLPTWEKEVRAHQITDREGRILGFFYTDLYPRESKRDGAWMHGLVASTPPTPHIALFCANAQPPTKDTPSLMSFRDVETVFHEFGHLLHHCLSQVSVRSLACTRVAQDFVELPSQIMENWCSEKEALDGFAHHYETSDPIPEELVSRLLAARNYRAANAQMRQLGFAATDLALHVTFDPDSDDNVNDFANKILQQYSPTQLPAEYALISSFSHLFSHSVGYAAGYYSYKWAEVLDADAFSRFKQEGLFSSDVGEAFRKSILAQGDSDDPLALFEQFMGRPPALEPMLERQGLLKSA